MGFVMGFIVITGWLTALGCGTGYFINWMATKDVKKR